jgi:hypothetical protein
MPGMLSLMTAIDDPSLAEGIDGVRESMALFPARSTVDTEGIRILASRSVSITPAAMTIPLSVAQAVLVAASIMKGISVLAAPRSPSSRAWSVIVCSRLA